MPLANVSLTDTFDYWRTITNSIVTALNGNLIYFRTGNANSVFITTNGLRESNVYMNVVTTSSVNDISTSNIASANAVNTTYSTAAFWVASANANVRFSLTSTNNRTNTVASDTLNSSMVFANTKIANTSGISFNGNLFFPTGNVAIGTNTSNNRLYLLNGSFASSPGPTSNNWLSIFNQGLNSPGYNGLSVVNTWRNFNSKVFEVSAAWNGTTAGYYPLFTVHGDGQCIWYNGDNPVERMRLDYSGNLGIGTSSPTEKLEVNGNIAVPYGFSLRINGFTVNEILSNWFDGGADRLTIQPAGSSGSKIFFRTSNLDRAVIDNVGNFGLGITNPTSSLHVYNASEERAIVAETQGTTGKFGMFRGIAGSASITMIQYVNGPGYFINTGAQLQVGTGTNHPLVFQTNNTERMRITEAGKVGIGTASPGGKVTVYEPSGLVYTETISGGNSGTATDQAMNVVGISGGPFYGGLYSVIYGSGAAYSNYSANNGIYLIGTEKNSDLAFYTNNLQRVRIDKSGNFGIGTTSPAAKLDVVGQIRSSDAVLSNNGTVNLQMVSYGVGGFFGTTTNNPLIFQTNNTERARIDSSGNFGIGTTTPTEKLEVNGNAKMSGSITASGGVFDGNGRIYPKLIHTISGANTASISSSDVFSVQGAAYSDFMITFYRTFTDINDRHIHLRWYANGSYQTTNYATYSAIFNGGGSASTSPTTYYHIGWRAGNASNRGYIGNIMIYNTKATDAYKQFFHDSSGIDASAGYMGRNWGGGDLNIAQAITGFQIYAESGNISGTVKIYGLS